MSNQMEADAQTTTQANTANAATNSNTAAVERTPETDRDETSSHVVPVAESIRYRKRAQAAEQELAAMQAQLNDSQAELAKLRDAVSTMERRQKIDALLADADAVDVDVARLLTEAAVEAMEEPDVQLAIEELRRSKPYLFTARRGHATAMGARHVHDNEQAELAADAAARSGDRRDLLRYLRMRRNGQAV